MISSTIQHSLCLSGLPSYALQLNPCICVQVGGKAGFAWEKKWWEEVYESKLQKLQVLISLSHRPLSGHS